MRIGNRLRCSLQVAEPSQPRVYAYKTCDLKYTTEAGLCAKVHFSRALFVLHKTGFGLPRNGYLSSVGAHWRSPDSVLDTVAQRLA